MTNKHAYLIMAHNNYKQLEYLLQMLDHPLNDVFLHIDKRAIDFPYEHFSSLCKFSKVNVYCELAVKWGGYSQIETELLLFKKASNQPSSPYCFYHIISGCDLPIKSQAYIHTFFDKHIGTNFINIVPVSECADEVKRRARYFHFFVKRTKHFPWIYTFLHRFALLPQIILGINRCKDTDIYYGANWCSITHSLVCYLIEQEQWIKKTFKYVNNCDELFLQTLAKKGNFPIYSKSKSTEDSILRYIDFSKGGRSPKILDITDYDKLVSSQAVFARKFDDRISNVLTNKIIENLQKDCISL